MLGICSERSTLRHLRTAFADTGIWNRLIRQTTKTAEILPVNKTEETIARLSKTGAASELLETELKGVGRISPELKGLARESAVRSEVARAVEKDSGGRGTDPSSGHHENGLGSPGDCPSRCSGRQDHGRSGPGSASRGRMLKEGGAELIAAVGLHGEEAALTAQRLDHAIKSGHLVVPKGMRAPSLADFGNAMTKFGPGSWEFWKQYVIPHWKEWAACGALTAYLLYPEEFQNAAGEMTERGFDELTKLGGKVLAAAIRGTGKGSDQAAQEIGKAVQETYALGGWAIAGVIGSALLLLLSIPMVRRVLQIAGAGFSPERINPALTSSGSFYGMLQSRLEVSVGQKSETLFKTYHFALFGRSSAGKTCLLAAMAMDHRANKENYTCTLVPVDVPKPSTRRSWRAEVWTDEPWTRAHALHLGMEMLTEAEKDQGR